MKLASGRHCPVYTRVIVTPWAHNVHYFWCNVTATGKLDVYTSTMSETPESFQLSCTRYSCRPILTTNSHFLEVYERYTLEWRYLSLTFWHCRTWDDCDLWLRLIRTLQAKLLVLIKSSHFSHSCVHMFSFASSTHMRKKLRVRSYLKLIHRGSRSDVCLVKYCFTHVMICTKFGNSFLRRHKNRSQEINEGSKNAPNSILAVLSQTLLGAHCSPPPAGFEDVGKGKEWTY